MKFRYLIGLLGVAFTTSSLANNIELTISSQKIDDAGIRPVLPQIFIFNKEQSLLFHRSSVTRGLAKQFKPAPEIDSKASLKAKILGLLPEEHHFDEADYTLVFLTDADAENFCPPCVTQEKINHTVINRVKDKSIAYIAINKLSENSRTFEMLSTEEFERRYGKIK